MNFLELTRIELIFLIFKITTLRVVKGAFSTVKVFCVSKKFYLYNVIIIISIQTFNNKN